MGVKTFMQEGLLRFTSSRLILGDSHLAVTAVQQSGFGH